MENIVKLGLAQHVEKQQNDVNRTFFELTQVEQQKKKKNKQKTKKKDTRRDRTRSAVQLSADQVSAILQQTEETSNVNGEKKKQAATDENPFSLTRCNLLRVPRDNGSRCNVCGGEYISCPKRASDRLEGSTPQNNPAINLKQIFDDRKEIQLF